MVATAPRLGLAQTTINLPVILNGQLSDDVSVTIDGDAVSLDPARLGTLLEGLATEEFLDRYLAATAGRDRVALEDLSSVGLDADYDPRSLEIRVELPVENQRVSQLNLRGSFEPDLDELLMPAEYSGYLNVLGSIGYTHSFEEGGESGREPLFLNFDGALRLFGFSGVAFQGEAFYEEDADQPFRRGTMRLVHDDFDNAIRYSAGDLFFTTTAFQNAPQIGGLSMERQYDDIQPFRFIQPGGSQQFIIEEPSTVDVYVNGILTQTLSLRPGRFDLREFTFFSGTNDVRLIVENAFGQETVLEFTSFFNSDLLAPGLSEFVVTTGVLAEFDDDSNIEYDFGEPVFSGFYRRGVTDWLTPEISFQAGTDVQSGSIGAIFASPLGATDIDIGGSVSEGGRYGAALALDHRATISSDDFFNDARFDLSLDLFTRDFAALAQLSENNIWADAAVRYSQPLPYRMNGSLGMSFTGFRDDADEVELNMTLGKSFDRFSVLASGDVALKGDQENRFLVTLVYRLGTNEFVRASFDSIDERSRVEYVSTQRDRVDAVGARVGATRDGSGDAELFGELTYSGNRFEAELDHDFIASENGGNLNESRTRFSIGTAIAFADGQFALGRPIFDSFAILRPHATLSDSEIRVEPTRDGDLARTDALGPALTPDMSSYFEREIPFDVDDLPTGYALPTQEFRVFPALNSGFLIEVGTAAAFSVIGEIIDTDGNPVGLVGGEAIALDSDSVVDGPITFFTNRAGRFVVQGLAPGEYDLRLFTAPPLRARLVVPEEDDELLLRVGVLTAIP